MIDKLKSRKFWIAVAAFLASLGSSIAGIATENETLAWVGIICTTLSAAIYAASEAYVDAASAEARQNITTTTVTATSNSRETVEKLLVAPVAPVEAETPKQVPPANFE